MAAMASAVGVKFSTASIIIATVRVTAASRLEAALCFLRQLEQQESCTGMIKKFSETTCMDIFEVPGLDEFKARGWFEISPYKDMSRLVFSREPLRQGLFTASEKKGKEEQNI